MKILLVVPPFATTHCPSIALSILKAVLNKNNMTAEVLYSNLLIKRRFLFDFYERIINSFNFYTIGEYIFSAHAFPDNRLNLGKIEYECDKNDSSDSIGARFASFKEINELKKVTDDFLNEILEIILAKKPDVVGFTLTFQQVCSSIAIANLIKSNSPGIITVIGGFSCTDPMGKAITDIAPSIDYAFNGEADFEFLKFCRGVKNGILPEQKIVDCAPVDDLNELPYPDYSDFFTQVKEYQQEDDDKYVNFESSRGCWWRNIRHCIFCGIDPTKYRTKNPSRVSAEIEHLVTTYDISFINTTDSILAQDVLETAFKNFRKPAALQNIFYEIKPTARFEELRLLKSSGINVCQPGIETLSDDLTKVLNKGTITANNIRFLRDCKTLGIIPLWNFLIHIPGEKKEHYVDMMENVIPYLSHLQPPLRLIPLMIHRYSPLFNNPGKYNIENVRPVNEYFSIFPAHADINNLAYYFEGDYKTAFEDRTLKKKFFSLVEGWRAQWENTDVPSLKLLKKHNKKYVIEDTRNGAQCSRREIDIVHYQLLKRFEKPVPEDEIEMRTETKNLLEWKYMLKTGKYYISLL